MKLENLSIKALFWLAEAGATVSMLTLSALLFAVTGDTLAMISGGLLTACALVLPFLLTLFFGKLLSQFTANLCRIMDAMINGGAEPAQPVDTETLFAHISCRLLRLYGILQQNRRRADKEQQKLQRLVSDISHQVKTPVSNLKMMTDTLLTQPVTEQELYLKLDITDTGKGIAESRQAAVFRRFYREQEVCDRPGVGIGLYLAREIITRQGGYIGVTSKVGRGSVFSVFLPRE